MLSPKKTRLGNKPVLSHPNRSHCWYKYYRQVLLITFTILLTACSSLKTPHRDGLVDLKALRILGSYPVVTHQENALNLPSNNVIWNYFLREPGIDSAEVKQATHFTLEMADTKNVKASLYNGEHLLKTRLLKGKLKNGYFRLKHRLKWQGVPIIFWALSSEKTQFGIGNEQQLYIDHSSTRTGGILIIGSGTPDITTSSTILPYKP